LVNRLIKESFEFELHLILKFCIPWSLGPGKSSYPTGVYTYICCWYCYLLSDAFRKGLCIL